MILLFDIGNSRLKWRFLDGDNTINEGAYYYGESLSSSSFEQLWATMPHPSAIWGVSVAGQVSSEALVRWCQARWAVTPQFIASTASLAGVTNGYKEPKKLGADRWAALLGADALFSGACCIADCGTAVTVDCLDSMHNHLGGVILPGLRLMPHCVVANTANVELSYSEESILGRDTSSCLAAGAFHAITGALERTASSLEETSSFPVHRVITGGDAERLLPWLGAEWHYVPDLVFIGVVAAIKSSKDNA